MTSDAFFLVLLDDGQILSDNEKPFLFVSFSFNKIYLLQILRGPGGGSPRDNLENDLSEIVDEYEVHDMLNESTISI